MSLIFFSLVVSVLVIGGLGILAFMNVAFAPRAGVAAAVGCSDCPQTCAKCRLRLIPVTPPELLAIANHLKTSQSAEAVEGIGQMARANARTIAAARSSEGLPTCPLRATDGSCLADGVRPSACRVARAAIAANHTDDHDFLLTLTAHDVMPQIDTALYQGLQLAGLDSTSYELNGALAVALATPDVARRWRNGDTVFAGCPVMSERN